VKDIVFDVGRVLIDFRYDALFQFFYERGVHFKSVHDFAEKTDLKAYECGRISNDDFINNLAKLFNQPLDLSLLMNQWTEIFEPITEMLDFALDLKKTHRIFFLSNTSALHWEYLLSEYKLKEIATDLLASFQVGAMKPERKIFKEAERRFGLLPGETLFIDDIEENALGAVSCGWHGIHHVGIEETKIRIKTWLS